LLQPRDGQLPADVDQGGVLDARVAGVGGVPGVGQLDDLRVAAAAAQEASGDADQGVSLDDDIVLRGGEAWRSNHEGESNE